MPTTYEHVLLTLDGSLLAKSAIPHAARAAGPEGSVAILQVIRTEDQVRQELQGSAYEFIVTGSLEDVVHSAWFGEREAAHENLAAAADQLRAAGVGTVEVEVREGLAGNEIIDCSRRHQSDVIVMATRGHSGLGREVLGSVAEYVLRHAEGAAVLLVGPRTSRVPA